MMAEGKRGGGFREELGEEGGKEDCVGQLGMRSRRERAGISFKDEGGTYEQSLRMRPTG